MPSPPAAEAPPAAPLPPVACASIFWAWPITGSTKRCWILISSRDRFTAERAR